MGSVVAVHGFSSCCAWVQYLGHSGFIAPGMWDPSSPFNSVSAVLI